MGWGLAGGWAAGRLAWPRPALAGTDREVRLALLADAHLKYGDHRRAAAAALARAVAEIRALRPAPDLVLFAGDLAHRADPRALALGREILSDLPAPLFMVMGEGDGLPDESGPWRRLFGEPRFSHSFPINPPSPPLGESENLYNLSGQGPLNLLPKTENRKQKTVIQVLGLHASWCPGPAGPGFCVGESGRRWLARELACLDPEVPLVVLSHAPLARIFRPWQQWTADAPQVAALLAPFRRVLCLHGHVHLAGVWGQGPGAGSSKWHFDLSTENRKPETESHLLHQGLPATAWPRPLALMGTPPALRPGLGPWGCGWAQLSLGPACRQFQPRLWQA
jgi:predicted MPP superfamily phosphohydrolase